MGAGWWDWCCNIHGAAENITTPSKFKYCTEKKQVFKSIIFPLNYPQTIKILHFQQLQKFQQKILVKKNLKLTMLKILEHNIKKLPIFNFDNSQQLHHSLGCLKTVAHILNYVFTQIMRQVVPSYENEGRKFCNATEFSFISKNIPGHYTA